MRRASLAVDSRHRRSILLLGDDSRRLASCVLDHLVALPLHSRHSVRLLNPVGLKDAPFLDLDSYDAVAIHYSLAIDSDEHLSPALRRKLRDFYGLKLRFGMDEYRDVDACAQATRDLGVDVLFTCVPQAQIDAVYGDRLKGVEMIPVLTGYVPDRLLSRQVSPLADRQVDIGYRGRSLPFWIGEFAQEKRWIGEGVQSRASALGLRCDIAWSEEERLYGSAWDERLASWRSTLAVEAGSSIVDHDGSVRRRTLAYVEENPNATFADAKVKVLTGVDGNVDFRVISSRVLEAIAMRTALVMFPGEYSGVVEPNLHYLVLERDFSNLDKVAAALREPSGLEPMVDRAYKDVVASGRYSFRTFAATVDDAIDRHLGERTPVKAGPAWESFAVAAWTAKRTRLKSGRGVQRALRGAIALASIVRDHDLRRLAFRYAASIRGLRARPDRVLADLLKVHLLRQAIRRQVDGSQLFSIAANFRQGDELRLTGVPPTNGKDPPTDGLRDENERTLEAAIQEGRVRRLSWDLSLVGEFAQVRFGRLPALRVGRGGVNHLEALAEIVNRFPVEGARVLAPLLSIDLDGEQEPLTPGWIRFSAWVATTAASLDRMGFVRAFETARQRSHASRPSASPMPQARSILEQQRQVRRAQIRALELDAGRGAPWRMVEHGRKRVVFATGGYEIEILSWDAYPDLGVPALFYRPIGSRTARQPAVIVALGSQGNVAGHDELYSAQRHAANLALRGFNVFIFASGLCFNGMNGELLDNSYVFETYGRLSGSGFTSRSIDVLMYLRAFDLVSSRSGVDASRIAASGYSYGGRMAYFLAAYEPRIAAVGLAATAVFNGGNDPQDAHGARRDAAMTSRVPDHFTNGEPERLYTTSSPLANELGDAILLAPRPLHLLLGVQDPGTSVSFAQRKILELSSVYRALDPDAPPPQLVLDSGSHHFDAARRRDVEDWLAEALHAEPVVAPAIGPEHETPLFDRSFLERRPGDLGRVTARKIHVDRALAAIAAKRPARTVASLEIGAARPVIADLLKLPPATSRGAPGPAVLAEHQFALGNSVFTAKFWTLHLCDCIDGAAVTLVPSGAVIESARVILMDGSRLLPSRQVLRDLMEESVAVALVYAPGVEPLRSPQERLGDLAMKMSMRIERTLLGIWVETVRAAIDTLLTECPEAEVTAIAHGVDAGNAVAFATVMDDRIVRGLVREGMRSFGRFWNSDVPAVPPPTLSISGLAAEVDMPDLVRLAGPGRLTIESECDLSAYVLDLRPPRP